MTKKEKLRQMAVNYNDSCDNKLDPAWVVLVHSIIDALPDEPPQSILEAKKAWDQGGPEPKAEKASEPTSASDYYASWKDELSKRDRLVDLVRYAARMLRESGTRRAVARKLSVQLDSILGPDAEPPELSPAQPTGKRYNSVEELEERLIDQQIEEVKVRELVKLVEATLAEPPALHSWVREKLDAILCQRSDPPATSGATQPTKETSDSPAWDSDWGRKLRIMKAMEEWAIKNEEQGERAKFQFRQGVWESFGKNWAYPVLPEDAPSEAKSEEPLWEGEAWITPHGSVSLEKCPMLGLEWRKIKVREVRP